MSTIRSMTGSCDILTTILGFHSLIDFFQRIVGGCSILAAYRAGLNRALGWEFGSSCSVATEPGQQAVCGATSEVLTTSQLRALSKAQPCIPFLLKNAVTNAPISMTVRQSLL